MAKLKEIKILHRYSGNVLVCGKYESIKDCLEKNKDQNLRFANLRYADLRFANLRYADLRFANLRYADLRFANLPNIPILNALTVREYIKKYKIKRKGTKLTMYKGVTSRLQSPTVGNLTYKIGTIVEEKYLNADPQEGCGHGINVCATKEQAKEWGTKVVQLEVDIIDIGCIPLDDKKIRVKRVKVIKEVK